MLIITVGSFLMCFVAYSIIKHIYDETPTEDYKSGSPCLTFEQFLSFYNISPDKFYLDDYYVYFYVKNEDIWYGRERISFYFKTNKDLKMYQKWKNEKTNRENQEKAEKESIRATEKLIELMKEEIKKKQKEADSQISESFSWQNEILRRMKNDD